MEVALMAGSIISNGAFIGVAGYLVKRWMDKKDIEADQNRIDARAAAKTVADELKETVIDHKNELKDATQKLEGHLDRIYEQIKLANGRTAKLEGAIAVQKAICEERHG